MVRPDYTVLDVEPTAEMQELADRITEPSLQYKRLEDDLRKRQFREYVRSVFERGERAYERAITGR